MTDIDGVDPPSTAIEKDLGKAAGRGADIERNSPLDDDPEVVERVGELDAAARDPGMIALLERKGCVRRELFTGFSTRRAPQLTRPARISACAFVRLSAKPCSTRS